MSYEEFIDELRSFVDDLRYRGGHEVRNDVKLVYESIADELEEILDLEAAYVEEHL